MTRPQLHDALHEVASTGAGTDVDVTLARLAANARLGGRRAPRWRMPALVVVTATATVALLVVGLFAVTRPPEVVPASGPGSLPDQVFPTREHILTLQQAPIGRVSMAYTGAEANGEPAWIAVGADSDEYRWVAAASSHPRFNTNLDVSPDGALIAIGRGGDRSGDLGVDILDASSGTSTWIALPDDGAGGRIEQLRWDASGERVGLQVSITNGDDPDGSSASTRSFIVTASNGDVESVPSPAAWADALVGWSVDGALLVGNDEGQASRRRFEVVAALPASQQLVGALRVRGGAGVVASPWSVSPSGRSLAVVRDGTDLKEFRSVSSVALGDLPDGRWAARVSTQDLLPWSVAVAGWSRPGTTVVSGLMRSVDRSTVDGEVQYSGHVRQVAISGEPVDLVTVQLGDSQADSPGSFDVRLAQDILASGQVRSAEPPHQPWYDPRTLGPAVVDWVGGRTVLLGWVAVLVIAVAGGVVVRRRARH